jgi:hypothetical protein
MAAGPGQAIPPGKARGIAPMCLNNHPQYQVRCQRESGMTGPIGVVPAERSAATFIPFKVSDSQRHSSLELGPAHRIRSFLSRLLWPNFRHTAFRGDLSNSPAQFALGTANFDDCKVHRPGPAGGGGRVIQSRRACSVGRDSRAGCGVVFSVPPPYGRRFRFLRMSRNRAARAARRPAPMR